MNYAFNLRYGFPKADLAALAARRSFGDEDFSDIGHRSRARGYYTMADFCTVCESVTNSRQCRANTAQHIQKNTANCISASSEHERIDSLRRLSGVSWTAASVFLHFTFEGQYPTLSTAALWSWGFNEPPPIGFEFWWAYVKACRTLALECGVTMRDLDRGLRQFATERKGRQAPSGEARGAAH